MRILFLCYWGIEDGLTAATVIPHLKILSEFEEIEQIVFYTIERDGKRNTVELPAKVIHVALPSGKRYLDKFSDFTAFPSIIERAIADHHIDFMFCRGTPAGALGYLVYKKTGKQYAVESFEPHARYMVESGVWKKWGLRYNIQRWMESRQLRTARFILPVSLGMKTILTDRGMDPSRILVMPCAVDHEAFAFDATARDGLRNSMNIAPDCVTGIYVGKFGGMYLDAEAFDIFKFAFDFFRKFRLIILSPDDADQIRGKLLMKGIAVAQCDVLKVAHHQVPAYLSAADFAFALYKPSPSKRFLSPVKIGEYWAAGLPIILPEDIGDDSETIQLNEAGATFRLPVLQPAFETLRSLLERNRLVSGNKIRELALRYRSFEANRDIYKKIVNALRK